jgi:hypothetical protein
MSVPRGVPYEEALATRVKELRAVFEPPYADLAKLTLHDQEPGECIQCDALRVLAREDPTLSHEIDIQPGVSILARMTYRAHCECGWVGDWCNVRENAERQGSEHVANPTWGFQYDGP